MLNILSSIVLAFCMLFSTLGSNWSDSFDPESFEQIGVESKADGATRIMSFNIRSWYVNDTQKHQRVKGVVDQIKEINPDSFGLQEVTPFWSMNLSAALKDYKFVGVYRGTGEALSIGNLLTTDEADEACYIFYKSSKFNLKDSGTFWLSETPETPSIYPGAGCNRVCTWAILEDKASGESFVHMNTHLDFDSYDARIFGSELIASYIAANFADMKVVLTGDLNSGESGAAYGNIASALYDARKTAADSVGSIGTFHGGDATTGTSDLDYIFLSDGISANTFRVVTTGINGRYSSDHFPIYADITL